jgi:hypothetical protein
MPRLTPEEQKQEAVLIRAVEGWPLWPYLPVKQYQPGGGWPKLGSLFDRGHRIEEPVIIYASIDEISKGDAKVIAQYDTLEAMLADNWVVD